MRLKFAVDFTIEEQLRVRYWKQNYYEREKKKNLFKTRLGIQIDLQSVIREKGDEEEDERGESRERKPRER